ncbi:MAG: hypothetical protein WA183_09385 [Chthoniobacterales bacterium]
MTTPSNRFVIATYWGTCLRKTSLRVLDLVDRYHATADAFEQCGEMLHTLRIERYWEDYAL